MAFDKAGNLYLSSGPSVLKFAADGSQSTFASWFKNASGLAFDHQGNLFVSDLGSLTIYRCAPDGTKAPFFTGTSSYGMAFDGADNLFLAKGAFILKITPEGVKSTFASGFGDALDLAFDAKGSLFVLDPKSELGCAIFKVGPTGTRFPFALSIRIDKPGGLAVDTGGKVYLTESRTGDARQAILKFSAEAKKSVFAVAPDAISLGSIAVDPSGDIFVFNGDSLTQKSIFQYSPTAARTASISPDGQWEYRLVSDRFPEIGKVGEKQAAVDLIKDREAPYAADDSVVWAPDSQRFAFAFSPPHAAHTRFDSVVFYQLHGTEWTQLPSLTDDTSHLCQLAQLGKTRLPKRLAREPAGERDILQLVRWVDADTAIVHAYSAHSGGKSSAASYDFTLKFDAQGKWKIVEMHPAAGKE